MPLENADKDKDKNDPVKAPAAKVDDDHQGREGTEAEKMLDRIVTRYGATPEGIAKGVYDLTFGEREKVMLLVQQRFGNGFTNEVEHAIGQMNQDRASGGGGGDGKPPPPSGGDDQKKGEKAQTQ
jgi:hypothetical protein